MELIDLLLARTTLPKEEIETHHEFSISIPIRIKRCGVETKQVVEKTTQRPTLKPHADSVRAIQEAVKKGILWNEALLSGQALGINDLARQNDLGERLCNPTHLACLSIARYHSSDFQR